MSDAIIMAAAGAITSATIGLLWLSVKNLISAVVSMHQQIHTNTEAVDGLKGENETAHKAIVDRLDYTNGRVNTLETGLAKVDGEVTVILEHWNRTEGQGR